MLLVISTEKTFLERFTKKNSRKTDEKEFRVEKVKKEQAINYTLNGKGVIILTKQIDKTDIA